MTRVAPGSHSTHNSRPSLGRNVCSIKLRPTFLFQTGGEGKSQTVECFLGTPRVTKHPPRTHGAFFGTLGGVLGVPWGGLEARWGDGDPLEVTFGEQAAMQNHWFYNLSKYILIVRWGPGETSGEARCRRGRAESKWKDPREPEKGRQVSPGPPKAGRREPKRSQGWPESCHTVPTLIIHGSVLERPGPLVTPFRHALSTL